MNKQQALEILKQYNAWGRCEDDSIELPQHQDRLKAIDIAIRVLEAREMETIDNI